MSFVLGEDAQVSRFHIVVSSTVDLVVSIRRATIFLQQFFEISWGL